MDKPLTSVELPSLPLVTKRQRLQRLADVIRSGPPFPLYLFINFEYRDAGEWKYLSHLVRRSHSQHRITSCTPPGIFELMAGRAAEPMLDVRDALRR